MFGGSVASRLGRLLCGAGCLCFSGPASAVSVSTQGVTEALKNVYHADRLVRELRAK